MPPEGSSRFELIRRLGAGSIGVVYEAYDRERDMRIALKQLRSLAPTGWVHLQREFRVLRGASHPNVIELYELVLDQTPPFITMELIEGEDFISHVRKRRRAVSHTGGDHERLGFDEHVHEERLRSSLAQVAQALEAIHESGIVHRDLKPSNVMVTPAGRAVVMDFSIAAEARTHSDEATSGGIVIGTPDYMAPEQAAGDPPTPAADWYALGVVLYQAITGRLPFEGAWNRVIENKQAYDAGSVSAFVADVPADLQELCVALLARHPHERPSGSKILSCLGVSETYDVERRSRRLESIPFVDRSDELEHLNRAWDLAVSGHDASLLLLGSPGMGKTRLVREFVQRVADTKSGIALCATCHPVDSRCFNAFDEIVDQLTRMLVHDVPKERIREILPTGHDLLPRMFPAFSRVPGVNRTPRRRDSDLQELRALTTDVLRELLANVARVSPLLVCIEDVQWADRDSVDLLCDIFGAIRIERVLLLMTIRPIEDTTGHQDEPVYRVRADDPCQTLLETLGERASRLELSELARDAQDEILAWVSGKRSLLGDLSNIRSSVPRLLIERARHQFDVPASHRGQDSNDVVADAVSSNNAPSAAHTLAWLLERRLATLSGQSRALLDVCALVGKPAPLALLAKVVDLSITERQSTVDTLRLAGLVSRVREGREPWLTVCHEDLRKLLIGKLSAERAQELNHRLAMALQRSGNASNNELGAQWRAADDQPRALSYLELAAKSNRDRFAFHRAAAGYRAALDVVTNHALTAGSNNESTGKTANHLAAVRLAAALADVLARAGRLKEAAELYERSCDSDEQSLAMCMNAAGLRLRSGDIEGGLERLLSCATQLGVAVSRIQPSGLSALVHRARLSWHHLRYQPRNENEIAARDLQYIDNLRALAMSLHLIAPDIGAQVQAAHLLEALHYGERHRASRARADALVHALVRERPNPPHMLEQCERLLEKALKLDDAHIHAMAHLGAALAHRSRGALARADRSLHAAIDMLISNLRGAYWELTTARYLLCMVRLERGDLSRQSQFIAHWLERSQRQGDSYRCALIGALPNMWRSMITDQVEGGLSLLDTLECSWSSPPAYFIRSCIHLARAMGWLYLQNPVPARAAFERCTAELRGRPAGRHFFWDIELACVHARIALLEGDSDEALRGARALERLEFGTAPGHAALIRGALAYRAGDQHGAANALSQAITRFERSDAGLYVMSASLRLARVVPPERGDSLMSSADAWCDRQAIANKTRMLDYLCPWSSTEIAPAHVMSTSKSQS